MVMPRVAIVGRPNVGKSSILNMLARDKLSIVDPTPGTTRDRVSAVVQLTGPLQTEPVRFAEVVDTGGFGIYTTDENRINDAGEDLSILRGGIEYQIAAAVESADVILFVVDAQAGITALDQTVAKLLRERALGGKDREALPVVCVANKVDSDKWEPDGLEAAGLGFGEPWLVSAKVNFRRRDFRERLYEVLPEEGGRAGRDRSEMKLAIVGRRNVGKSSLTNALAGEERVIVSEIAGTTRDAVDVRFTMPMKLEGDEQTREHSFVAIDTAGLRKRSKLDGSIEHFAQQRSMRAIERGDVCLLVIDSTEKLTGIDKRLGRAIVDRYRPCVVVVNKWDLADGRIGRKGSPVGPEDYRRYIEDEITGLSTAPIVFSSAKDGYGLKEAVGIAFDLFEQAGERVSTGRLNSVVRGILSRRGPSSSLGRRAKILYVSQIGTRPPTIVLVVNRPELFTDDYRRYMLNRFREELPFGEVPIRLIIRERRREELSELLTRPRKGERGGLMDEGEDVSEVFEGEEPIELLDAEDEAGR